MSENTEQQQQTDQGGQGWTAEPHTETVRKIAQAVISRANHQGWKGKKGDANAIEATVGALMAAIAIHGEDHNLTHRITMLAYLTSIRGLAYVRERATEQEEPKEAQD